MEAWINVSKDYGKIVCYNADIERLYHTAFYFKSKPRTGAYDPDFSINLPCRFRWESKDSTFYYWPGRLKADWKKIPDSVKTFCFEMIVQQRDTPYVNRFAVNELNRFFGARYGIEAVKERREVDCWILKKTSAEKELGTKAAKFEFRFDEYLRSIEVKHTTINAFLYLWLMHFQYWLKLPVVDETGFNEPIDLSLKADPKDFEQVAEQLKTYGLILEKGRRTMDMIIVRDKKD